MKSYLIYIGIVSCLFYLAHFNAEPLNFHYSNLSGTFQVADTIPSPEKLVQGQLEAYNLKDLEAFLSFYSDDIKAFNFPDKEIFSGKQSMRRGYESFFTDNPGAQCEILQRMIMGNTIIDYERISGLSKGDTLRAMVIFKIDKGKINRVYFIRNN